MRFQARMQILREYIARTHKKSYSWKDFAKAINIKSRKGVQRYIRKLKSEGRMAKDGKGRATRYRLIFEKFGPSNEWVLAKVQRLSEGKKGRNAVCIFPSYYSSQIEKTPVSLIFLSGGGPMNIQYITELQDLGMAAFLKGILARGRKGSSVEERIKEHTPRGYYLIGLLISQKGMLDYVKNMSDKEVNDKAYVDVNIKPQNTNIAYFEHDLLTELLALVRQVGTDPDKIMSHPQYKEIIDYHTRKGVAPNITRKHLAEIIHQYKNLNL